MHVRATSPNLAEWCCRSEVLLTRLLGEYPRIFVAFARLQLRTLRPRDLLRCRTQVQRRQKVPDHLERVLG